MSHSVQLYKAILYYTQYKFHKKHMQQIDVQIALNYFKSAQADTTFQIAKINQIK